MPCAPTSPSCRVTSEVSFQLSVTRGCHGTTNSSGHNFIPLSTKDARGAPYTIGHAIIWDPKQIRMELIVSHETLALDCFAKTFAPYYKQIEPWKELAPLPGMSVREAAAKCPGGIGYFNAGESGMQVNPLIANGRLLTKPEKIRALMQKEWKALDDTFTFLLQHSDGRAEIRDLRIAQNQIHLNDSKYLQTGTNGFFDLLAMFRIRRTGVGLEPKMTWCATFSISVRPTRCLPEQAVTCSTMTRNRRRWQSLQSDQRAKTDNGS